MIFLQVVPHDIYFQWQIEVQIVNFRKFDISQDMHVVVWYPPNSAELPKWQEIQNKYEEVQFFFYEDSGVDLGLYIPQLRPHSLKKHFKMLEDMGEDTKSQVYFYHDSDILFRELPDFEKLINDDIAWQSNCSSYLDYSYLRAKEVEGNIPEGEAIQILADAGGVTPFLIKAYDKRMGGAQSILKRIDSDYWQMVEDITMAIRRKFFHGIPDSVNRKYFPHENAGFQSWTCDMWALNFALWRRGIVTDITKDLEFSWATDTAKTYSEKPIYHNAGATKQHPQLFYKGKYMAESPIGKKIPSPPKDTASYYYWLAIQEVK